MKYAVRAVLAISGVVGLCSCESLPTGDPFEQPGPSKEEAIYRSYNNFRSNLGAAVGDVVKMNAYYSPNW